MKEQLYNLLQGSTSVVGLEDMALRVVVAAIIGLAIFLSYWISHAGTIYSQKFNINLITLTVLTATVMAVIGNNIALSLGMVGALSIVRFRTAIKDARDTTLPSSWRQRSAALWCSSSCWCWDVCATTCARS